MTTYAELATQAHAVDFKQGDLCHLEFPVTDLERAKKFYGEIFGWQFHDVPEMDYTLLITPSGKLGGGFFKPSEQCPARVVNYFSVTSIDETLPEIEARGGKAVGPKVEVGGHGTMQHLQDSEGNFIALWQSA